VSDIDKLIELAKQGPLTYETVMDFIQNKSIDCMPSTILEVCCMSRGMDCGAISYLFSVVASIADSDTNVRALRYESKVVKAYNNPARSYHISPVPSTLLRDFSK
jgi:hypothetical protein